MLGYGKYQVKSSLFHYFWPPCLIRHLKQLLMYFLGSIGNAAPYTQTF